MAGSFGNEVTDIVPSAGDEAKKRYFISQGRPSYEFAMIER
jgi:hypothetical protein